MRFFALFNFSFMTPDFTPKTKRFCPLRPYLWGRKIRTRTQRSFLCDSTYLVLSGPIRAYPRGKNQVVIAMVSYKKRGEKWFFFFFFFFFFFAITVLFSFPSFFFKPRSAFRYVPGFSDGRRVSPTPLSPLHCIHGILSRYEYYPVTFRGFFFSSSKLEHKRK